MGHEPRGFIAMKQNGVTMKQNGIFRNGMMKNVILHHGMMKNAILHHGVMKNGICSMVSDAKLCNNVANYGTKITELPFAFNKRKQFPLCNSGSELQICYLSKFLF